MATTTSVLEGKQALRRRTRSEGRPGEPDGDNLAEPSSPISPMVESSSLPSDEGFASGNVNGGVNGYAGSESDDEDFQEVDEITPRVRSPKQRRFSTSLLNDDMRNEDPHSGSNTKSRSWYEFDLVVVIALVSPVGNWVTGGDHVKVFFSLLLLIWYLHQIIEVPWRLYHKSRPKIRDPHLPPSTAQEHYKHIATSELRKLEMFYLTLSAISPLIGAFILRTVTVTVLGTDAVSWFSTTLFVLATGMRPWSHIVERLGQRTTDLHDVIHYPSTSTLEERKLHQTIDTLSKRIEKLEASFSRSETTFVHSTEEVYEYIDEALMAMDKTVRKHEKRYDKHEAKVRELEQVVVDKNQHKFPYSLESVSSLISALMPGGVKLRTRLRRPSYPPRSPTPKPHSFRTFPSTSSATLETIPEELPKYPLIFRPTALVSSVVATVGYFATLPLRAVVRMVLRRY